MEKTPQRKRQKKKENKTPKQLQTQIVMSKYKPRSNSSHEQITQRREKKNRKKMIEEEKRGKKERKRVWRRPKYMYFVCHYAVILRVAHFLLSMNTTGWVRVCCGKSFRIPCACTRGLHVYFLCWFNAYTLHFSPDLLFEHSPLWH